MRLLVAAVGRLKDGPERLLEMRYRERAEKAGRAVGLTGLGVTEIAESRATRAEDRRAEEAAGLVGAIADADILVALDETGIGWSSARFAEEIGRWRDSGTARLAFAIGGPDGHGDAVRARARHVLSLGPMTFPHQLVRVLLAEQIYRAVTILAGHPYHRA